MNAPITAAPAPVDLTAATCRSGKRASRAVINFTAILGAETALDRLGNVLLAVAAAEFIADQFPGINVSVVVLFATDPALVGEEVNVINAEGESAPAEVAAIVATIGNEAIRSLRAEMNRPAEERAAELETFARAAWEAAANA